MKISYRREMKRNYLIVEPEGISWKGYEYQMILENSISGLLPFSMMQTDGQTRFYYEITSRQPLTRLLEGRTISEEEIRRLIFGIAGILDQLDLYLLNESGILLLPEYVYVEPDSFRLWLCLVPGLNHDFPEACSKLLEYLLGHVDHQNQESVILAYGLYQETRKENYGIEDIMKLIQKSDAGKANREPEMLPVPELHEYTGLHREPAVAEGEKSWKEKTKGWFTRKRKTSEQNQERVEAMPWKHTIMETIERPATDFVSEGQDTALLLDTGERNNAQIAWLRSLDGAAEDIALAYYPFVIGKQKNLVDYVLDKESVSRLHLKIDQSGDQYFITDLNSTNGTKIRGRQLENNETKSLNPGDEVEISVYKYQFDI
ncbi:MAG: DUF6382 domain-containing protein [Lachnospiraceae bacterium]